ncbi:hypothetical protein B0H66DRAFT_624438 [Apodospora peruviana]|uniref:NAD(P)-binding protein n=1 Tax=Apodospora peruviana TaxID=516989 RepID=A0AAE0HZI5_9PEZI|nr:hypothetical protein B0H66DRAFT_624438 [Apodospora peruviana]
MASTAELWHAARNPPTDPKDIPGHSFKDKAVLVTGAYGDKALGHHAAIKYAALGANLLILAVRTAEKGEEAKAAIIRHTNCSPDIFIIETVDLASFASVREFVDRLNRNSRVPYLHVVQLAAGVAPWAYGQSPDGYEISLQVDVLSTALLALLLLPKMREAPDGVRPHLSFLDRISIFIIPDDMKAELEALRGESLIKRCDDKEKWDAVKHVRYYFLGRSAEQGARTLVSATALGEESHGRFWTNDKYHP